MYLFVIGVVSGFLKKKSFMNTNVLIWCSISIHFFEHTKTREIGEKNIDFFKNIFQF